MTSYYDELEIRKAIDIITEGRPYEIRILFNSGKVMSGYYSEVDKFIEDLRKVNLSGSNVYITLNELHPGCYCRIQRDRLLESKGKSAPTTQDQDVVKYRWMLIDLDPLRPTGISSSEEEFEHSREMAQKVIEFMHELGFDEYVLAQSGNGYHLLYKIDLPVSTESKKLLEDCLKAVDESLSDDVVKVDTTNFNPSRICKLYGTLAQKGSDTKERPFRMSRIVEVLLSGEQS